MTATINDCLNRMDSGQLAVQTPDKLTTCLGNIYSPFDGIFETSDLCDTGIVASHIDIDEDRNIRG
jgi:hypothetical protein